MTELERNCVAEHPLNAGVLAYLGRTGPAFREAVRAGARTEHLFTTVGVLLDLHSTFGDGWVFGVDRGHREVAEDHWRAAAAPPGFAVSESPRYVGRAVVALAADPRRARWNQQSVTSAQLAAEYGFTDVDGSRPDVWRYNQAVEDGARDIDPSDFR